MPLVLCLIFFASGLSALVLETLWFHGTGLALGNGVWASSLVLAGFMAGLALGNLLAARHGSRIRDPLRAYAILEVLIGASGFAFVVLLPELGGVLAPWLRPLQEVPWALNLVRLVVAFALLLVPSTAMGLTLPLLTKVLAGSAEGFGRILGRLYAWNTLGAVTGAVATETWLLGALGVRGSGLAACALNLAAAGVALAFASRMRAPSTAPEPGRSARPGGRRLTFAVGASGFCLLALEVVWFRFLSLYVIGHSESFAFMLGIVLAGIACGGLVVSWWLKADPAAHRFVAPACFAAGLLCMLSYATAPIFLEPFGRELLAGPRAILSVGLPLMLPVSFLSGAIFTLVGAALRAELDSETATAGRLTFANTLGAAVGSLVAGFVLLPALGMELSFFVLGALYGAVGALLLLGNAALRSLPVRAAALSGALAFLVGAAWFPFGDMESRHLRTAAGRWSQSPDDRVVAVREGVAETLIYLEQRRFGGTHSHRLVTNALSMAGNDYRSRRYMKLYVHLPAALHPSLERALVISYGLGSTTKALVDQPGITSIDVVDISRDVLEMGELVHPEGANPLWDPRVHAHVEDGRYFLQTTERRFDLITGEPPPPTSAGVVNLYTREYFSLMRGRLAEGGMVTYWLPVLGLHAESSRSILRAFCDVFDDCSLWHGAGTDLMMVGTRGARGPAPHDLFEAQWRSPLHAVELEALGFERPEQLGALFVGDARYLNDLTRQDPPLVDDRPKRIAGPRRSPPELPALYRAWADADAARGRFARSDWIRRMWPEELIRASLPEFEWQRIINVWSFGLRAAHDSRVDDLHRVLTRSDLRAPALWLLRSDGDMQRLVKAATAADEPARSGPAALDYQRAAGRIAERDYAAAVPLLERAERDPSLGRSALAIRLFALCMDGRADEARDVARTRFALLGDQGRMPSYWAWMGARFGVDPRALAREPGRASNRPG
jgi:predicted membrane-bound spermidine synthase